MKEKFNSIGVSTLSILSSTIIVVPFMLLLRLHDGSHQFLSILPFVLFYIFRMTGIFFIRGIKTTIDSYGLLKISLNCGLIGCLFSIFGYFYFPSYVIAGVLLGFSAAWLPPSNLALSFHLKSIDKKEKMNRVYALITLLLLTLPMMLDNKYRTSIFFLVYFVMYIFAIYAVNRFPQYENESHELEDVSYPYLFLFAIFLVLLFFLRSSRLLLSTVDFNYFIMGMLFLILVSILLFFIFRDKITFTVPMPLSTLTMINGFVGNYLFLFSSLYASGYYGSASVPLRVYLPYVLGMVVGPFIKKFFKKDIRLYSLIGIAIGTLLIFFTSFFSIGVLITSSFKSMLNSWLNTQFFEADYLPKDKRFWVKYSIQNTGSIIHQFTLMIVASLIVRNDGLTVSNFFTMTVTKIPTAESMKTMTSWNHVATALIFISVLLYSLYFIFYKKNQDISQNKYSEDDYNEMEQSDQIDQID